MSEATRYPLSWPVGWKRTAAPKESRFGNGNTKPSVDKATTKLLHELHLLPAYEPCIISTNIKLRLDGLPYSGLREPDDKGVAVYFHYDEEDRVIACDSFKNIGCNIYAIAMTIEAMRGINRWGCSELMQRAFTGFKALPERASAPTWFSVLELHPNASEEQIKERYRELIKKHHPDAGGDPEKFMQVKLAYEDAIKQFTKINS